MKREKEVGSRGKGGQRGLCEEDSPEKGGMEGQCEIESPVIALTSRCSSRSELLMNSCPQRRPGNKLAAHGDFVYDHVANQNH